MPPSLRSPLRWLPAELRFPRRGLPDPIRVLAGQLKDCSGVSAISRGQRVAVAVGSRGIPHIADYVATVVASLHSRGADPFVVPAMGTHGGATSLEQAAVLADLGITAERVGAPVISGSQVVDVGPTASGLRVWVDRAAWEADAVIPVNRIKPHTAFRGLLESGPAKLLAVGLGKDASARECHRAGLASAIPEILGHLLATDKVPCGVALVEDAWGGAAAVEVLEPTGWLEQEGRLLGLARELYPKLPWTELDLLVVENIGKDISGTGMDLNVVGMSRRFQELAVPPHIRRIVALNLTPASRGNANGVGYADVVTRTLAEAIDWDVTRMNCQTTGFLEAARLPPVADGSVEAVRTALAGLSPGDPAGWRAVRIRDTLHLGSIQVSPALAREPCPLLHRTCG